MTGIRVYLPVLGLQKHRKSELVKLIDQDSGPNNHFIVREIPSIDGRFKHTCVNYLLGASGILLVYDKASMADPKLRHSYHQCIDTILKKYPDIKIFLIEDCPSLQHQSHLSSPLISKLEKLPFPEHCKIIGNFQLPSYTTTEHLPISNELKSLLAQRFRQKSPTPHHQGSDAIWQYIPSSQIFWGFCAAISFGAIAMALTALSPPMATFAGILGTWGLFCCTMVEEQKLSHPIAFTSETTGYGDNRIDCKSW